MVKLTVTDATRAAVIQLTDTSAPGSSANLLPVELLDDIQRHVDTTELRWIDHKLLARISRWNSARPKPSPRLALRSLIAGTRVYVEPVQAPARSAELEAILAPIRLANERASYAAMLSTSPDDTAQRRHLDVFEHAAAKWDFRTASAPTASIKEEWDSVRKELGAVANVLASAAAVATAVWWASGNTPLTQKTFMSLFGAIAIAAIEGFLYLRYFQRQASNPHSAVKVRMGQNRNQSSRHPPSMSSPAGAQNNNKKGY